MARKLYSLTEEHRARMEPWARRWTDIGMSTKAMDDEERRLTTDAILGMYAAAKLPPPKHIVFVPSPIVLAFAGGFAAARWWMSANPSADVTRATGQATWQATEQAVELATRLATWQATGQATGQATWRATGQAWHNTNIAEMIALAGALGVGEFGLRCANNHGSMWNGGNQWSGYPAWLSFFRHIVHLDIDYSAWQHYEAAAIHAGPRIMHPDFCMVSDRPERLLVDAQARPHCEDGPFARWRDGAAFYAWHGMNVPEWVIEHPERIDVASIDAETNTEVRRVMRARFGLARFMREGGAVCIHEETSPFDGTPRRLWRREVAEDHPIVMIEMTNSTPEPEAAMDTVDQYSLAECGFSLDTSGSGLGS